ncbi:hypothetical protein CLU85_0830 [Acidovorax sp. 69]|uniref:DUF2917 domain-containing protein n=1 Tax=Acidovorax sp. 69 TaxID=2035202 RepID=UPI000C230D62|nr:DUF2917 domain-containing protein [Acidovorax sp. 69]PJI96091.1 hypothetical protein CLU85_0830 [Acidovorax sp. 69]
MSPRNVLESQQSVQASVADRPAAGCWKLATGQALSLRPRTQGVLEIARGQVWLTLTGALADRPGAAADYVLRAGDRLVVAPGQHVVMEAWNPRKYPGAVAFRWDGAAAPVAAQPAGGTARDWESGVVLPLRDLVQALAQGGRAVVDALAQVAGAGGRFAVGFARFALYRIAPQRQRRTA